MRDKPNVELMVLCVTLLIETLIRSDLTEMLRPYSQSHKVISFYVKSSLKSNYKCIYTLLLKKVSKRPTAMVIITKFYRTYTL